MLPGVFASFCLTPVQLSLFPRPCGRRWLLLLLPMYVGVKLRKIPRFLDARGIAGTEHWMMTKFGEDDNEFSF